jgi:hypothetical protein
LWTAILTVQAQTLLDLKSQGRNVDFSGAVATKPFRVGTTLPAVCNIGEAFFKSDAPPGSNLYTCTATNTWTVQSGSGGAASLPTTTNLVKGNGSGGAAIANPGADYYKPGMAISSMDLPLNVATTDGQNTFSDPGNQYFGKYDVACDATGVAADNVLVKKSGAACVTLSTSDTKIDSGLVGLLVSGSTTTSGRVRKFGVGDCSSVGTIAAGDWIVPSTTTAGYCEGSSSRPTAGTVIIGRANGPSGGTVPVDIQIDPNATGGNSDHSSAINSTDFAVAADNVAHTLSWDTNEEDVGGIHSTSTTPARFTIQHTGWYGVACQVFGNTINLNNNMLELRVVKNGSTVVADDFFAGTVAYKVFRAAAAVHLVATDYLTCDVRSNVTGNITLTHGSGLTFMQVTGLNGGGAGGSSTPGGSDTQLQYNSAGSFSGSADFTLSSHTLAGGASAILNMGSAPAATGLKIPTAAGAAPTADGQIAVDSTAHALKFGSNGSTKTMMDTTTAVQSSQLPTTVLDGSGAYCADAGSTDAYACTLSPAPGSYVTGARYRFKANTANTGSATINFNSLGAKPIKKAAGGVTTDIADNDIRAGQVVDVVYDGTNMQMQSTLGNAAAGGGSGYATIQSNGTSQTQRSTVNFIGRGVTGDDGTTLTNVRFCDPSTSVCMKDDFVGGNITAGSVGELGWSTSVSGSAFVWTGLTDPAEPGNVDLETGTTSGSIGAFYIPARTTAFDPSSNFDMTFRVKADSSSNVTARAGYGDSTSSFDAPANGIYLEHLDTDTNWFCVARASSTQARTNSAVAFGTSWIWLRVRRKDASTIGCTVATTMANVLNTANEVTVTTNIPTAGTGMLSFTMIKNTAAADKHWALGYFDNIITGLTR